MSKDMSTIKFGVPSVLRSTNWFRKEAIKFQFDLLLLRVHGLASGNFAFKWTQGSQIRLTEPFIIEKQSNNGFEVGQKLSLLCTLYRTKYECSHTKFDMRDAKLSILSMKEGNNTRATIAKLHFNLAEYVGGPCAETKTVFKFNSRHAVETQINVTFVKINNWTSTSIATDISSRTWESSRIGSDSLFFEQDNVQDLTSSVTIEGNSFFSIPKNEKNNDTRKLIDNDRKEKSFSVRHLSKIPSVNSRIRLEKKKQITSDPVPKEFAADDSGELQIHGSKDDSYKQQLERVEQVFEIKEKHGRKSEDVRMETKKTMTDTYNGLGVLETKQSNHSLQNQETTSRTEIRVKERGEHSRLHNKVLESVNHDVASSKKVNTIIEQKANEEQNDNKQIPARNILINTDSVQCLAEDNLTPTKGLVQHKIMKHEKLQQDELDKKTSTPDRRSSTSIKRVEEFSYRLGKMKNSHGTLGETYCEPRSEQYSIQDDVSKSRNSCHISSRVIESGASSDKKEYHPDHKQNEIQGKKLCSNKIDDQIFCQGSSREKDRLTYLEQGSTTTMSENKSLEVISAEMSQEIQKDKQESNSISQSAENLRGCFEKHDPWYKNRSNFNMTESHFVDRNNGYTENKLVLREDVDRTCAELKPLSKIDNKIEALQHEIQSAMRLDKDSETEIYNMNIVIAELVPLMEVLLEKEGIRKSLMPNKVKHGYLKIKNLEESFVTQTGKEAKYLMQISQLTEYYQRLEESSHKLQMIHELDTLILRTQLEVKINELQLLQQIMESSERELKEKKNVIDGFRYKTREVESERLLLEMQSSRDLELASNTVKALEKQNLGEYQLKQEYQYEVNDLLVTVQNLREQVNELRQQIQIKRNAASVRAIENLRLRNEAKRKELNCKKGAIRQQETIDHLQGNLSHVFQLWNKDVCQILSNATSFHQLFTEVREEERISLNVKDNPHPKSQDVTNLRDRIIKLSALMEKYSRTIRSKSNREKQLIVEADMLRKYAFDVAGKLAEKRKKCEAQLNEFVLGLLVAERKLLNTAEKNDNRLFKISQSLPNGEKLLVLSDENERPESNIRELSNETLELNQEVETLRNELSKSQQDLSSIIFSSHADKSRTRIQLQEARIREKIYREELKTKQFVITELRGKLLEISSANITERIAADIELIESRCTEKTYQVALERQENMMRILVARFNDV